MFHFKVGGLPHSSQTTGQLRSNIKKPKAKWKDFSLNYFNVPIKELRIQIAGFHSRLPRCLLWIKENFKIPPLSELAWYWWQDLVFWGASRVMNLGTKSSLIRCRPWSMVELLYIWCWRKNHGFGWVIRRFKTIDYFKHALRSQPNPIWLLKYHSRLIAYLKGLETLRQQEKHYLHSNVPFFFLNKTYQD